MSRVTSMEIFPLPPDATERTSHPLLLCRRGKAFLSKNKTISKWPIQIEILAEYDDTRGGELCVAVCCSVLQSEPYCNTLPLNMMILGEGSCSTGNSHHVSHSTHMNESCNAHAEPYHTHEWVMSHTWKYQPRGAEIEERVIPLPDVNESCQTYADTETRCSG